MSLIKAMKLSVLSLLLILLCSCGANRENAQNGKLRVVTTLFPQYDFASTVGGERAQVTKLLPWGAESHTYDPSVGDIAKIADADIFVYTGKNMESWAANILDGTDNDSMLIVDLSENLTLLETGAEHNNESSTENEGEHVHDYDSHIWTNPENALVMVDNILAAFCEKDSENAQYYKSNADTLKKEISALSASLENLSESYDGRTLWFGGRFAFLYMFEEYGFNYKSPYIGCGEHSEPGIKTVTEIISQMKKDGVRYIFFEEMSDAKIAKSIAAETGAELLLLHSCHNLSKDEAKAGMTYISLMQQNIQNLKKAICEKGDN